MGGRWEGERWEGGAMDCVRNGEDYVRLGGLWYVFVKEGEGKGGYHVRCGPEDRHI